MTDTRVSQLPVEEISSDPGSVRDSQNPVETVIKDPGSVRVSQVPVETIRLMNGVPIRTSQMVIEVITHTTVPFVQVFIVT